MAARAELQAMATMSLRYLEKPADPPAATFGSYLGRGDGTIEGPLISGTVAWDLFERQGETACRANLIGWVRTPRGGEVGFEALGFFRREPGSDEWLLTSAIRFSAPDGACGLHNRTGVLDGVFDMRTYEHHYRVLMQPDGLPTCTG